MKPLASYRRQRRAFSLLEVILALAILVAALAVIGELNDLGLRSARQASALTEAQLLCDGKLAEIAAGVVPAVAAGPVPLETDPAWLYIVGVTPLLDEGLIAVQVTVMENLSPEKRPAEFTLVRWMVDPTVAATEAALEADAATELTP